MIWLTFLFLISAVAVRADYGDVCAKASKCTNRTQVECPVDSTCSVPDNTDPCGILMRCSGPITGAPTYAPTGSIQCSSTGSCTVPDTQCPVGYDCGAPVEHGCGFIYYCVPNGETAGPTRSPTVPIPDDTTSTSAPTDSPTTGTPTDAPSISPTTGTPTDAPSISPTSSPTGPTPRPTNFPTVDQDGLDPFVPTPRPTFKSIKDTKARGNMDSLINSLVITTLFITGMILIVLVIVRR